MYNQINELNDIETNVEFLINDNDSDDSSENNNNNSNNNNNIFNSAATTLTKALKTGGIIRTEDEKELEYNQKALEKLKVFIYTFI